MQQQFGPRVYPDIFLDGKREQILVPERATNEGADRGKEQEVLYLEEAVGLGEHISMPNFLDEIQKAQEMNKTIQSGCAPVKYVKSLSSLGNSNQKLGFHHTHSSNDLVIKDMPSIRK